MIFQHIYKNEVNAMGISMSIIHNIENALPCVLSSTFSLNSTLKFTLYWALSLTNFQSLVRLVKAY